MYNCRVGYGITYYENKKIQSLGYWDQSTGEALLTHYDIKGNIKYEGEIKDNNANGYGIIYYDNKVKQYEREWKNGNNYLNN